MEQRKEIIYAYIQGYMDSQENISEEESFNKAIRAAQNFFQSKPLFKVALNSVVVENKYKIN